VEPPGSPSFEFDDSSLPPHPAERTSQESNTAFSETERIRASIANKHAYSHNAVSALVGTHPSTV
jgi:hypothetical protein